MALNQKWTDIKTEDKTVAETDRELGATNEFLRERELKAKLESIDRMLASIRDRLESLKKDRFHTQGQ